MAGFRPTEFTQDLFDEICRRLIEGDTLKQICESTRLPSRHTFYGWIAKDSTGELKRHYDMAREFQVETWADEAIDIADDGRNDWMERWNARLQENEIVVNKENVMRSELRIKTRQWLARVYKPKRFGDKTQVEISGDPNKPLTTVHRIEIVGPGEGSGLIEHQPKAIDESPSFLKPKVGAFDFEG